MAWKIELTLESKKQLGKLDRASAKRIRDYLRRQVESASDPRGLAKPLKGRFAMLWRLRTGSYRPAMSETTTGLFWLFESLTERTYTA